MLSRQIRHQRSKYVVDIRAEGLGWWTAMRIIASAVCYDEGKKHVDIIQILSKLQVEQERQGIHATSVSGQSSMSPQSILA